MPGRKEHQTCGEYDPKSGLCVWVTRTETNGDVAVEIVGSPALVRELLVRGGIDAGYLEKKGLPGAGS